MTDDFERSLRTRLEDGWVLLGTATWTGMNGGTEDQVREHAAEVGASCVEWVRFGAGYRNLGPAVEPRSEGVAVTYRISKGKVSTQPVSMPPLTGGCAQPPPSDTTQARLCTVKSSFWARRLGPPVLGAVTYPLPPASHSIFAPPQGIAVMCVVRGSPAEAAGLIPRDVLVDLDGTPVRTEDELTQLLRERRGTVQRLRYRRDGTEATVAVRLNR